MDPNEKKVFLVADDDEDVLDSIKIILERRFENASVYVAKDGMEAYKKVQNVPPTILITDLSMPKMSGNDLVMSIIKNQKLKQFPVIIISGVCRDERYISEALNGRFRFLPKPFKSKQIIEMIEFFLNNPLTEAKTTAKRAIMESVLLSIHETLEKYLQKVPEKGKPEVKPEKTRSGDVSGSVYFTVEKVTGVLSYCFDNEEFQKFCRVVINDYQPTGIDDALTDMEEQAMQKLLAQLKEGLEDHLLQGGLVLDAERFEVKKEKDHNLQQAITTNTVSIPYKVEEIACTVEFNLL